MAIVKVVIRSADVREKKVGDYRIRVQDALLIKSADEASKIELRAPDDSHYSPGDYTLSGESFSVDDYGRVNISKRGLVLEPFKSVQPARVAG